MSGSRSALRICSLLATPSELYFRLTDESPTASATVHLDSTGTSLPFTIASAPEGVTVSPTSGTTPANLMVSVEPASLPSGVYGGLIDIRWGASGSPASIPVARDQVFGDYVALQAAPVSVPFRRSNVTRTFAPGGLFSIRLMRPLLIPGEHAAADAASLAPTLAGFSFTLGGIEVPLRSYSNEVFWRRSR